MANGSVLGLNVCARRRIAPCRELSPLGGLLAMLVSCVIVTAPSGKARGNFERAAERLDVAAQIAHIHVAAALDLGDRGLADRELAGQLLPARRRAPCAARAAPRRCSRPRPCRRCAPCAPPAGAWSASLNGRCPLMGSILRV